jgi:hypothetical protein
MIICRPVNGIVTLAIEGITERQFMCFDRTERNVPDVRLYLLSVDGKSNYENKLVWRQARGWTAGVRFPVGAGFSLLHNV